MGGKGTGTGGEARGRDTPLSMEEKGGEECLPSLELSLQLLLLGCSLPTLVGRRGHWEPRVHPALQHQLLLPHLPL